ncbi:MAG: hypothetical protein QGF68_18295, partial [Nitrospinota bacterium]|nr:hypothetical protein [Nitrospinota bacterium]
MSKYKQIHGTSKNVRRVGRIDIPGGGQVTVVDKRAYIGHMGAPYGTTLLDVSDPKNIRTLSHVEIPEGVHTHKVRAHGDIMLTNVERHGKGSTAQGGLKVYDVSNPAKPKEIAFFHATEAGVHRFDFDGRYVYFAPLAAGDNEGIALRLDTKGDFFSPGSWTALDGKGVGLGTCVGAVCDGRFIYYVPYARSVAVRYDTFGAFEDPESWEAYNAAGTTGMNTRGYDGGCYDGRYIYYVPFHEGENSRDGFHCRLLRYDTMKGFGDPSAW